MKPKLLFFNYIFLLLLLQLISVNVFCQVGLYPDIEWEKTYGGSAEDMGRRIYSLSDGTILLCGTTRSNDGDVTYVHDLAGDIWLAQIDTNGTLMWEHSFGGHSWDLRGALHETPDGGYAMTGMVWGSGGDVDGYHDWEGLPDGWFVKLDSSFNIEWNNAMGTSDWEYLSDFAVAPDGYILIGGHGGYDDDSEIEIYKIDNVGEIVWDEYFGGTGYEDASQILQTSDGGYIIVGTTSSNNFDVSGNHGESDAWIFKINPDGEMQWQKCLGGSNFDGISRMQQTPDNGYIFLGSSRSNDGDVTENKGDQDIWVIKTDSMANIEWQRTVGGSSGDSPGSINLHESGYLISGHTSSIDGDVTDNDYLGSAMWLVKLGFDGSIEWTHCYGGNGLDYSEDLQLTNSRYYSNGITTSTDGDISLNHGLFDFWVVTLKKECEHLRYFEDYDGDGFGNLISDTFSCVIVTGFITDSTDCNDFSYLINPATDDICNIIDDNCNGLIDEDAVFTTYFEDLDGDGFGDALSDSSSCFELIGYVIDNTDCNDSSIFIYPGAEDICNSTDDNCNGLIDEDAVFTVYFADIDSDGFGDVINDTSSCFEITGFISDSTDCNDTSNLIYPGAEEICDYLDNDCNGIIDDSLTYIHSFEDADGDTYGNVEVDSLACNIPDGFVIDDTDCDDTNPLIYPGSEELLNGVDDNCNELIDEGLSVANDLSDQIKIYPNPADDQLLVECNGNAVSRVEIYSMSGAKMFVSDFTRQISIDLKYFSSGVYLIKFSMNDLTASQYFVKL